MIFGAITFPGIHSEKWLKIRGFSEKTAKPAGNFWSFFTVGLVN
jgi:hypothetical protein